jgi:serine/threonine protein kinase
MQINLSKAMKRFKAVDFSLNSKIKKQIQQEVNILKQIEHENLVKFFDLLVIDLEEHSEQRFYIFTEYYEVSNLSQFSK